MMKKLTFLFFIAFLSTLGLFAQSKELASKEKAQTVPLSQEMTIIGMAKVSENQTYAKKSIQNKNLDALEDSNAMLEKSDLALTKQLRENKSKSLAAKQKRDAKSDAIKKRLAQSEEQKAALKTKTLNADKQCIELEQKRAEARKKALQSYEAPSSKELANKKSNQ